MLQALDVIGWHIVYGLPFSAIVLLFLCLRQVLKDSRFLDYLAAAYVLQLAQSLRQIMCELVMQHPGWTLLRPIDCEFLDSLLSIGSSLALIAAWYLLLHPHTSRLSWRSVWPWVTTAPNGVAFIMGHLGEMAAIVVVRVLDDCIGAGALALFGVTFAKIASTRTADVLVGSSAKTVPSASLRTGSRIARADSPPKPEPLTDL